MRYLIGVDEAGRAPLAGPVAVGAAMVRSGFDWSLVGGVRDSKRMTERARENMFRRMQALRRDGALRFAVSYAPHSLIDRVGITKAVAWALSRALERLGADPSESAVYLDGLLRAPEQFTHQQTLIGGDDVLPVISLAAVAAKVSRDHRMVRLARKYPGYHLELHKGYPTRAHREAIFSRGLSDIHRVTFCAKLLSAPTQRIDGSIRARAGGTRT